MATTIRNTGTNELHELTLMSSGIDFLFDVMANSGMEMSEREDCEFELDNEETLWWERWARREQRILDRTEELGEEAEAIVAGLAQEYGHDFELLQDETEKALGIEEED